MMPYNFYLIFDLLFALCVAVTLRDFGPMRRAEARAVGTGQALRFGGRPLVDREIAEVSHLQNLAARWGNLVLPIGGLIACCGVALFLTGLANPDRPKDETAFWHILGYARFHHSLLYAAIGGTILAFGIAVVRRHLSFLQGVEAWIRGARSLFLGVLILATAWALSGILADLSIGPWFFEHVVPHVSIETLPTILFLAAALASFSTGSSTATMAILFPIAAPIAWQSPEEGIRLASLAAVMSGAVLGDHLSPIANTAIFSSLSSAVDHVDHVKTQIPYAACAGVLSLVCGFIPVGFGVSPWLCLPVGGLGVAAAVYLFGRKVRDEANADGGTS